MTRPDLDALAALMDKATPGPWKMTQEFGEWLVGNDGYVTADCGRSSLMASPNNARLIVAAVNALPALLAYVRELERTQRRDPPCDGDNESCPICGPTLVHDGCCIRHGDVDDLWVAHDVGCRAAALAMRERCAQACEELSLRYDGQESEASSRVYADLCRGSRNGADACAAAIRALET